MNSLGPWRLPRSYGKEAEARRLCLHQIGQVAEILWASHTPGNADPIQTPLTKSPNMCKLAICSQWGNPVLIHSVPDAWVQGLLGPGVESKRDRDKGEVARKGHSGGGDRRVT